MGVDFKLIMPILVIIFILVAVAMVDLVKRDKSEIKGGNKIVWGAVILFISIVGPIIYLTLGKKSI